MTGSAPPPRLVRSPADRPLPDVAEPAPDGIPIRECGDPLVTVEPGAGVHVCPAYHQRGIAAAGTEIRVRSRVLDALRAASASLPDGIELLIWDGLRTLATQAEIVRNFRAELPEPGRDDLVEQYLALPPESERSFRRLPPPHSTGGAVDVTLCDGQGTALDLGAEFDQFDDASWLRYYEGDDDHPHGDAAAVAGYRIARRMLFWAMLDAGFAPYPWEYWHYEFGTLVAAEYYRRPAAEYGPMVPWVALR